MTLVDAAPHTTATATDERPAPSDSYVQSFARGLSVIRAFSAPTPRA